MSFRVLLVTISTLISACGLSASYYLTTQQNEFPSAFLLNFSTVFLEFSIIALIVEKALQSRESKKWAFAQRMISRSISTSYLDVTRLFYSLTTSNDIRAMEGFKEFVSVAESNLSNLRSLIEGFSPYLEQDVQEKTRMIERELRHLYRIFKDEEISTGEGFAVGNHRSFKSIEEICMVAYKFSVEYNRNETLLALRDVDRCTNINFKRDRNTGIDIPMELFFKGRWDLQSRVVDGSRTEPVNDYRLNTIRHDVSGNLALRYLVLDYLVFIAYERRNLGIRID